MADKASDLSKRPLKNRRRFRSHLVNGDVRLRLILDDALFALAAALTAIGILYFVSNREIGDSLWSAHVSIRQTRELLENGTRIAGIATFLAVLVFGIWSLIDAHRIAGPLHRLHRLLSEIGDGNLAHEIKFRRSDEFSELAEVADRLVDNYSSRLSAARLKADLIKQALRTDIVSPEQTATLRLLADDLGEQLSYFKFHEGDAIPVVDDAPLRESH